MALRHIALFQWAAGQQPDLDHVGALLAILVDEHHGTLQTGSSLSLSPGTFDYGLTADFPDEAAYQAYRTDARHRRLMEEILRPAASNIVAVQIDLH